MVVGYGGRRIVLTNSDTSYYGRILIKALSTNYPNNYYIIYSPKNVESNKRLTSLFNDDAVRVKFPRSYIHNKLRWYKRNGIVRSAKAHGVNTFHGIDDGIASGFIGSNFPTVFTMTDPLYKSAGWIDRMSMQRRARKACKIAKRVIALNETDRQIIIDHYHVNPDNVEVVYPCYFQGCDESVPDNMQEILRSKYHLPERFVLYKGRLGSDDNLKEAMQLIHELRNRKISVVLLGYRTPYFDQVIKEQAHDLHIFHRFKQVDKIHHADLTAVVKMAQAVIIPNTERIRDNYKLINAQRTGGLVICKDSPRAREYGGDGAIYYDSYIDGADKLSDILEDENKRAALLKASRENSERFTSKILADHMIHIYRSVLTHRRLYQR